MLSWDLKCFLLQSFEIGSLLFSVDQKLNAFWLSFLDCDMLDELLVLLILLILSNSLYLSLILHSLVCLGELLMVVGLALTIVL